MRSYRIILGAALVLLSVRIASAQYVEAGSGSSIDMPVDPRTAAMGEAAVASVGYPDAWLSNPAVIGGLEGAGGGYADRLSKQYIGLPDDGISHAGGGGWIGTPIGAFAFHGNRNDRGRYRQIFENGTPGITIHDYDYTFALTYACTVTDALRLGATIKYARWMMVDDSTGRDLGDDSNFSSGGRSRRVFLDIGGAFTLTDLLGARGAADTLHFGLAADNLIGAPNAFGPNFSVPTVIRVGGAWGIRPANEKEMSDVKGGIALEYQHPVYHESTPNPPRDFWMAGMEATFFDLVSLRAGVRGEPNKDGGSDIRVRYGAGLLLPLRRIGIDAPLAVSASYASMPPYEKYLIRREMTAFSFGVTYTAPVFR